MPGKKLKYHLKNKNTNIFAKNIANNILQNQQIRTLNH